MNGKMPAWKHVLITGAAQGLGRALSMQCAAAGIRVTMMDVNQDELVSAAAQFNGYGSLIYPIVCDVRRNDLVRTAFARARKEGGPVDAVICCAAIGDSEWKRQFRAERLRNVLDVNLLGVANCIEHCLPDMHAHGGGSLLLVSSLLDARGYAGTASYSVSKAALRALADSARVLLRSSGISVILVRPGFMRTGMTAQNAISMPGMMSAQSAAQRILHGAARGKSVISFPGWLAFLAEAGRLIPRPLFDRLVRYGMIKDGEAEDLHFTPTTEGGLSHGTI
jgi:NAD(P)-dependent dehydrogenase (short-subunit alcohol dehydrogenase family)